MSDELDTSTETGPKVKPRRRIIAMPDSDSDSDANNTATSNSTSSSDSTTTTSTTVGTVTTISNGYSARKPKSAGVIEKDQKVKYLLSKYSEASVFEAYDMLSGVNFTLPIADRKMAKKYGSRSHLSFDDWQKERGSTKANRPTPGNRVITANNISSEQAHGVKRNEPEKSRHQPKLQKDSDKNGQEEETELVQRLNGVQKDMNIYVTQSTPSNANPTVNVKVIIYATPSTPSNANPTVNAEVNICAAQTSLGPSTDASDSDENRQHEPEEDHIQTSSGPSTDASDSDKNGQEEETELVQRLNGVQKDMNIYVTQSTPSNANPTVNVKVRNLLFTDQTSLGPSTDASDSDENRQHEPEEDHIQTSSGPSTEDDVIYVSSDEDQQAPLDQLRPLDQRRGRSKRCPLCSTKFPKKNSYRCPVCNKTFVCISNVLRHLRTVHRMSEEQLNRIKPAINRSIKEQHSEEELSGEDEEFGSPLNNSTPTSSVRTLDRSNVTKRRQRLLS